MTTEQMLADAGYKMSCKILDGLLNQGAITEAQRRKINRMNIEKLKPTLAELYLN